MCFMLQNKFTNSTFRQIVVSSFIIIKINVSKQLLTRYNCKGYYMANSNCFYLFGLEHNHRKCRLTRLGFYSTRPQAVLLNSPSTYQRPSFYIIQQLRIQIATKLASKLFVREHNHRKCRRDRSKTSDTTSGCIIR